MLIRRSMLSFILLLFLWQLIIWLFNLPFYILPTPFAVLTSCKNHAALILSHLLPTLLETLIGLFFGIVVGIGIALLMMIFNPIRFFFAPIVLMSQAIPIFALAPLLVLWFGYGMTSKIITVILMLFFPITSAFYDGLKHTPQALLDMASTMTGNSFRILWYVQIPSAFPNLATGIRLATVIAPLGAVISEWIGSSEGLGYLILNSSAKLETDLMFACILTLMAMALLMYLVINKLLHALTRKLTV